MKNDKNRCQKFENGNDFQFSTSFNSFSFALAVYYL